MTFNPDMKIQKAIKRTYRQWLEKEAWRLFSLLVRQSEADENGICKCFDGCGKMAHWRNMDAGHFMSIKRNATKYDRKNVHPQSRLCNRFSEGKKFQYAKQLDLKYGQGTAEALEQKSLMNCKRTAFDLQYMIQEFKSELIKNNFQIR